MEVPSGAQRQNPRGGWSISRRLTVKMIVEIYAQITPLNITESISKSLLV